MGEWGEIARQENVGRKFRTLDEIKASKNHIHQWLLQETFKKEKKLLEVGAGMGVYLADDMTMGFGTVWGVELDQDAVDIAHEYNFPVIQGDMKDMIFEDATFDIVTAPGSIEHFPDTANALKEINRVMKPGGILLLNVPYRWTFFVIAKKLQQCLNIWKCGYEKSFTKSQITNLLDKNGFDVLDIDWSEVEIGKHPFLSGCLHYLDKIIGGRHMIWVRCQKR